MDTDTNVACPVCGKNFTQRDINKHVNECLNKTDDCEVTSVIPVTTRKRKASGESESSAWGSLKPSGSSTNEKTASSVSTSGSANKRNKVTPPKSNTEQTIKAESQNKSSFLKRSNTADVSKKEKEVRKTPSLRTYDGTSERNTNDKFQSPAPKQNEDGLSNGLNSMQSSDTSTGTSKFVFGQRKKNILPNAPLAEQMRPTNFDEYVGQDEAIGENSILRNLLQNGEVPSLILWGPPGCGKTSLAKVISNNPNVKGKFKFTTMSATNAGVNDVKEAVKIAKNDQRMLGRKTIIFLDEIHRFNKSQQDALLPHVEDGTIVLIGATTENPSFQVNNALLSRCKVIVLEKLDTPALENILERALANLGIQIVENKNSTKTFSGQTCIEREAITSLANLCDGDARAALNGLQMIVQSQGTKNRSSLITPDHIKDGLLRSKVQYDRAGEEHYTIISAFHKSIRGSDENAALYWLARMLEGGETPLYVARRLVRAASEDVGLADPAALTQAVSTYQACHFLGMPECDVILAQCAVYLARAPKSIEVYQAYGKAKNCVKSHKGALPGVPLHLRNASTSLTKSLGYGKGYKYNPNFKGPVDQDYLPEELKGINFFSD